jgi:DNA / pantothenate metabolism flavoprotein
MCVHKIQSSAGLKLDLKQVPKMLSKLTSVWAPESFVVSFKLETDEDLVVKKAAQAIAKYHVHMVVANQLQTRRNVVYLVSPTGIETGEPGHAATATTTATTNSTAANTRIAKCTVGPDNKSISVAVRDVYRSSDEDLIEPALVQAVIHAHEQYYAEVRKGLHKQKTSKHGKAVASKTTATAVTAASSSSGDHEKLLGDACHTKASRLIREHIHTYNSLTRLGAEAKHAKKKREKAAHEGHLDGDGNGEGDGDSIASQSYSVSLKSVIIYAGLAAMVGFIIGRIAAKSS